MAVALSAAFACGGGAGSGEDAGPPGDVDATADPPDTDASGADAGALAGDLEVGSAEGDGSGYVPIADGGDIPIHNGVQGSQHIWNGYRVRHLSGTMLIGREVRRASDGQVITAANQFELEIPPEAGQDWWNAPFALLNVICPSGFDVNGVEVTVHVSLYDEDGDEVAAADKLMVPRCPDPPDGCTAGCGG